MIIGIIGICIAAASLGILIAQEVRRWRERPAVLLTSELVGWVEINDERWELLSVGNVGTASAGSITANWHGVDVWSRGPSDDAGLSMGLPKTLHPGDHVRVAVRGDLSRAWILTHFSNASPARLGMQWLTIQDDGSAEAIWQQQLDAMLDRRRARRRPWRRAFWTGAWKRARPIGPYEGGSLRYLEGRRSINRSTIAILAGADATLCPGVAGPAGRSEEPESPAD